MFSVVIPLWNKESTIADAVRSVLAQSFAAFELIIVDDGSTDGSIDALAALEDARIRLIRRTNQGPGRARNVGIEKAAHDWFAFLDADDLWLPHHLQELDRTRARFPEAGLIGTRTLTQWGDRPPPIKSACVRIQQIRYFAEVARVGTPFRTSSAAIPRRTYDLLGGFSDARLGEDSEYFARIALSAPVATSTRSTVIYRVTNTGLTGSSRGRWHGLASRRSISPAIALIEDRYPRIASEELRRDLDAFVVRYLGWTLDALAAEGDVETVRALQDLYPNSPPAGDWLRMALAQLPRRLARPALRLASRLIWAARRFRGRI
jgi:glycosyltransferase involved in cell wall biosynthesis